MPEEPGRGEDGVAWEEFREAPHIIRAEGEREETLGCEMDQEGQVSFRVYREMTLLELG